MCNLIGRTFGRLTVIASAESLHRQRRYLCRCECGVEKPVAASHLIHSRTRSCGCLATEMKRMPGRGVVHGCSNHPEYASFRAMLSRCHNPRDEAFEYYGGRGISVCDRWRRSFEAFLQDMGPRPTVLGRKASLDRRDNDGDYTPANCYWASLHQQARNKRSNHVIEFQNQKLCLAEWAEVTHIKAPTIRRRLRLGWSVERALTEGVNKR